MTNRFYHNPRCSKSRQALALLNEQGATFETIEYLTQPLSSQQLQQLFDKLGVALDEFVRSGEAEYTELGFNQNKPSAEQLFAAMQDHPKLVQRPIYETDTHAVIGRPPERVLTLV